VEFLCTIRSPSRVAPRYDGQPFDLDLAAVIVLIQRLPGGSVATRRHPSAMAHPCTSLRLAPLAEGGFEFADLGTGGQATYRKTIVPQALMPFSVLTWPWRHGYCGIGSGDRPTGGPRARGELKLASVPVPGGAEQGLFASALTAHFERAARRPQKRQGV